MPQPEFDKIKELLRQGQIGMLTFDTSTAVGLGTMLSRGLLAQLAQFKHSRIRVVLSEIVVREIRRHIIDLLEADKAGWPRIAGRMRHLPEIAENVDTMDRALKGLISSQVAQREIDQFLENTGADVILAGKTNLDMVLDLYFEGKVPFGLGKKRCEFPDAIALLSLEEYAKAADRGIIVVSGDNDWIRFCETSESGHLFGVDTLTTALKILNESEAERVGRVEARKEGLLEALRGGELVLDVQRQLKRALMNETRARGTSHLDYVAEILRVEVGSPNFSDPTIVRNDDDEFVMVVDMRPHCMFWAQFHFYDEDFSTPLGTGVFGFGHHIDATALLVSKDEELSTEVILTKNEKLDVNFGPVAPDEDGVISHLPA